MPDKKNPEKSAPRAKREEEAALLDSIKSNLSALETLLERCSGKWGYDDPIYRFYHQSFKVFHLQTATREIVEMLQALAPHLSLNPWFMEIVREGTGKTFTPADNERWTAVTRPILEAFFHARYFLQMACKFGNELESPATVLPSGWAGLLYLYDLR